MSSVVDGHLASGAAHPHPGGLLESNRDPEPGSEVWVRNNSVALPWSYNWDFGSELIHSFE